MATAPDPGVSVGRSRRLAEGSILTFRGQANGEESPVRTIHGPNTQLEAPDRIDIDPVHGEIFVADDDAVLVYPRDASGDVTPIRVIRGPLTRLSRARSMAVDPVNKEVVVADMRLNAVLTFSFLEIF